MLKSITRLVFGVLCWTALAAAHDREWLPLPAAPPEPADNPTTPGKVALGKALFFDPRFSPGGATSCNTCHDLMNGGADDRPLPPQQAPARNAPTVWNAAFHTLQRWDGRATSLEEQTRIALTDRVEMALPGTTVMLQRLRAIPGYRALFAAAFEGKAPVTIDNAVKALAAYERTLVTPDAPYDRYVKGEKRALSDEQIRGMETFAAIGCVKCHAGPTFDGATLSNGRGLLMKSPTYARAKVVAKYRLLKDRGRFELTKHPGDDHLWRVPTLRNLLYTAPYFHNGAVPTLEEAVRVMAKTELDQNLVDSDVNAIVAFLGALSGGFPEQTLPRLPPGTGMLPR